MYNIFTLSFSIIAVDIERSCAINFVPSLTYPQLQYLSAYRIKQRKRAPKSEKRCYLLIQCRMEQQTGSIALLYYGSIKKSTDYPDIYSYSCSAKKSEKPNYYQLGFFAFYLLLTLFAFVELSVVYTIILRKMKVKEKQIIVSQQNRKNVTSALYPDETQQRWSNIPKNTDPNVPAEVVELSVAETSSGVSSDDTSNLYSIVIVIEVALRSLCRSTTTERTDSGLNRENTPQNWRRMSSYTNLTDGTEHNITIEELNRQQVLIRLPFTILITLTMTTGLVGNILTIYVYGFRLKFSPTYFFVVMLACADLIICACVTPARIAQNIYPMMTTWDTLCQFHLCLAVFTGLCNYGFLLAIAAERYRKVCQPLKTQINMRAAKIITACIFIFCAIQGFMTLLYYGSVKKPTKYSGIYLYFCSAKDDHNPNYYQLAFFGLYNLLAMVTIVILFILYTIILRRMKVMEKTKCVKSQQNRNSATSIPYPDEIQQKWFNIPKIVDSNRLPSNLSTEEVELSNTDISSKVSSDEISKVQTTRVAVMSGRRRLKLSFRPRYTWRTDDKSYDPNDTMPYPTMYMRGIQKWDMAEAPFGPVPDKAFPQHSINGIAMVVQSSKDTVMDYTNFVVIRCYGRRNGATYTEHSRE
ncbi:alpha-2Da adrenergic receptor-like [Octopus vulgaris]|uniref:Alpha-2Da adrenergic receptor-like n=1 Tax=Octopus vulgaris TaxID=6645 RepID=A0AA36B8M6_OCTVU|nr:alpha-2Da adrenergic receptor-like [Octopus vulgaris]